MILLKHCVLYIYLHVFIYILIVQISIKCSSRDNQQCIEAIHYRSSYYFPVLTEIWQFISMSFVLIFQTSKCMLY